MILQALKEYYDRKASDPDSKIAPDGWITKGIDFVIVLTENGDFLQISCLQDKKGTKTFPHQCLVPNIGKQAMKHTNAGNDANLLWDNSAFIFGLGNKGEKKIQSFVSTIESYFPESHRQDTGIVGVKKFMKKILEDKNWRLSLLDQSPDGEEIKTGKPVLTFKITGDAGFIFDRPSVRKQIEDVVSLQEEDKTKSGICLVTGEKTTILDCHTVIKGVWGAQTSGATIVGFNKPSFCSFQKEQGFNSPIGKMAANAYITALNHLLAGDSGQNLHVAGTSIVFWSERPTMLESEFFSFFNEPPKDDPDRNSRAVESLFKSFNNGTFALNQEKTRFYVLGLAPNASRISIRFWIVKSIPEMADKIRQHFEDMRITHSSEEGGILSLYRMLSSIAAQGKSDNVPPNITGEFMRSILEGLPYPETLLQAAVRRNRAEQSVPYPRAALIKACINRKTRYKNPNAKEELKMSLDKENKNIGYRLGRLFATLEKIQQEASPGINATIRDRFYGAASSTPATVFGNLMRLKNHHLAKLENTGRKIYFEKLIGEIMEEITDFPAHMPIADQGRFAVGYYHQTQDFFPKKEDKN